MHAADDPHDRRAVQERRLANTRFAAEQQEWRPSAAEVVTQELELRIAPNERDTWTYGRRLLLLREGLQVLRLLRIQSKCLDQTVARYPMGDMGLACLDLPERIGMEASPLRDTGDRQPLS
jgi:hypothetical protein